MTAKDDDCPAVVGNLRKAQKSWARLTRILGREGGTTEVIQDVLQGGSAGSVYFRVVDVGPGPPNGTGPGQGLDLERMWTAAREAERMEGEENMDGTETATDD